MIKLRNIHFNYGNGKMALKNINLDITARSTIFVGPNGSGKTTLLKIISLIYKPTIGEVLIDGINPWNGSKEKYYELKRKIVYVHEKPIFFRGTILDNLVYPLTIRGIEKEEAEEKALKMLEKYELDKYAHRNRNKLSAGEGQIISIIRALIIDPEIIALDEPTSNLDSEKRELLGKMLREKLNQGKKLLISTHDLLLAAEIGEKVYFIKDGTIDNEIQNKELINIITKKLGTLTLK